MVHEETREKVNIFRINRICESDIYISSYCSNHFKKIRIRLVARLTVHHVCALRKEYRSKSPLLFVKSITQWDPIMATLQPGKLDLKAVDQTVVVFAEPLQNLLACDS